jgi:hypothetical protein
MDGSTHKKTVEELAIYGIPFSKFVYYSCKKLLSSKNRRAYLEEVLGDDVQKVVK